MFNILWLIIMEMNMKKNIYIYIYGECDRGEVGEVAGAGVYGGGATRSSGGTVRAEVSASGVSGWAADGLPGDVGLERAMVKRISEGEQRVHRVGWERNSQKACT